MPVTVSPDASTTPLASRPFHAAPLSKMWPRPSQCVAHCIGIMITSSAAPIPCGNRPRVVSSVSVMVWTGLNRPRSPVCGPDSPYSIESEIDSPVRIADAPSGACPRR